MIISVVCPFVHAVGMERLVGIKKMLFITFYNLPSLAFVFFLVAFSQV